MTAESLVCSCGSELFVENSRCGGWWRRLIDGTGETLNTELDNVWLREPLTVTCAECGKRHKNPKPAGHP